MKNSRFYNQAELLLRILPIINRESVFALKGGTAINFFVRNLPRLSVDIDLVYLPVKERDESLAEISEKLLEVEETVLRIIPGSKCQKKKFSGSKIIYSLIISTDDAIVKIEPNTTIRGSVYPPAMLNLCTKGQELFETSMKVQSLIPEELYAGKICAALDRQHPRDLYDVQLLFENEGITDKLRKAFIVYLISHNRPIVEVLNPHLQDIREIYEHEFIGMTLEEIPLAELEKTRTRLVEELKASLTENEKKFLISFKNLEPDWELLELRGIEELPSVKWKLKNIASMDKTKHKKSLDKLMKYLE